MNPDNQQRLFVVIRGPSSVGKSTQARILSRVLVERVFPHDVRLCLVHGDFLSHIAVGYQPRGWPYDLKHLNMVTIVENVFAMGSHCIVEDVGESNNRLQRLSDVAKRQGLSPFIIRLIAREETLLLRNRARDPLDFTDDGVVVQYHRTFITEPLLPEELVIDTDLQTPKQTAEIIIRQVLVHYPWLIEGRESVSFTITLKSH